MCFGSAESEASMPFGIAWRNATGPTPSKIIEAVVNAP